MIASLRGVSESPLCMDMPRLRVKPNINRNFYCQETYSITQVATYKFLDMYHRFLLKIAH